MDTLKEMYWFLFKMKFDLWLLPLWVISWLCILTLIIMIILAFAGVLK